MVVDIVYEDNPVAMITQEKGLDNMEIEIFPPLEGTLSWNFFLDDFIEAVTSARKYLIESEK